MATPLRSLADPGPVPRVAITYRYVCNAGYRDVRVLVVRAPRGVVRVARWCSAAWNQLAPGYQPFAAHRVGFPEAFPWRVDPVHAPFNSSYDGGAHFLDAIEATPTVPTDPHDRDARRVLDELRQELGNAPVLEPANPVHYPLRDQFYGAARTLKGLRRLPVAPTTKEAQRVLSYLGALITAEAADLVCDLLEVFGRPPVLDMRAPLHAHALELLLTSDEPALRERGAELVATARMGPTGQPTPARSAPRPPRLRGSGR